MGGRHAAVTDDEILAGAFRAIGRHGARFTLAHVAKEVGLTAARMVQRFGSKQRLLHAVARRWGEMGRADLAALQASDRSPLDFLLEQITEWSRQAVDPSRLVNYLSLMRYHVDDPVLRRLDAANHRQQRRYLEAVLDRAVRVGELQPCDITGLARSIMAVTIGSYLIWAGYERGDLGTALRREITAVLTPYLTRT